MEDFTPEQLSERIKQKINTYIEEMKFIINNRGAGVLNENLNFINTTEIVPFDFFKDNKAFKCSDNLFIKDFGEPTILFTDLRNSTKILEKCETDRLLCLYTGYIYYSSKLLADVLDFVNGKIVEITGDGTYSIIEECNNYKVNDLLYKLDFINKFLFRRYVYGLERSFLVSNTLSLSKEQIYKYVGKEELTDISFKNFVFFIFAKFNVEINEYLQYKGIDIEFFTRVGCKKGPCKITRIEISKHVKVDKLIGTTVNKAAHQSMGK